MLPFPNINPIIIEIGPLSIHWYGLAYVVGILFSWWYTKKLLDNPKLWPQKHHIQNAVLDSLLTWAPLGILLGGRLGYVLLYDPMLYLINPFKIFAIWEGGMSFHGGALGVLCVLLFSAHAYQLNGRTLLDVVACSVPFGIGLVRCTNFINAELYGRITDVSWSFVFPTAGPEPRHPSQLYEALLEGLILFTILRILSHVLYKLSYPGFIAGAFIALYGFFRICIEFFREPDQQLGFLIGDWGTMGMLLSFPMILTGIFLMLSAKKCTKFIQCHH